MNDAFNKFPLDDLTVAGGYLVRNSFNKPISRRENNFENMDRVKPVEALIISCRSVVKFKN
jgi:hypothetical protein